MQTVLSQNSEPQQISAGDTVKWENTFSGYPASAGWAVVYSLRNSTQQIDITATANGDAFSVSVPSTTTESWVAGDYVWSAFASKSGERYTVGSGRIKIRPNLGVSSPVDARTYNEKMLDAIRASLQGTATSQVQEYTIGNRSIKYMTKTELRDWEQTFAARVAKERGIMPKVYGARFTNAS